MDIFVLNRDLELLGVEDKFTSLRWVRRYHKSGEFQIVLPVTLDNIELFKRNNIIYKEGDMEAGVIETRNITLAENGEEQLDIKGKFLTSYLDRRINWDKITFSGTNEELMRKIVLENVVNPKNINRKIPLLYLGELKGFSDTTSYTNSYGDVAEMLENISNTSGLGYRINIDFINKNMHFDVYKGVDRSINQTSIAPCIFAQEFENILEQEYFESINNFKNNCLIAGAGEGLARKKTTIGNDIGLDRYELFVDARDISDMETITVSVPDYDEEGNITGYHDEDQEFEIPWNRYEPMLLQRGDEKLEECKEIETFESKINTKGNNEYKVDYDLGDIVTIISDKWGLQLDTRITEIEEVYENGEFQIYPTFGNNIPTILDKIKQKMR